MAQLRAAPKDVATVARLNALIARFTRLAEDDSAILEAAGRAQELNDIDHATTLLALPDEVLAAMDPPWTKTELRIARAALVPFNAAPAYMRFAHERVVNRMRAAGQAVEEKPRPRMVVLPAATAFRMDDVKVLGPNGEE